MQLSLGALAHPAKNNNTIRYFFIAIQFKVEGCTLREPSLGVTQYVAYYAI